LIERRRKGRRAPDPQEPACRVRLRTGAELSVVDVSDGGALVEGTRLLPGTHLDVHVTTRDGRILVRSRVVRSYVVNLRADAVRYRGALAFERCVDTSPFIGYALPSLDRAAHGAQGNGYPNETRAATRLDEHRLTA
jgi:hypothetical protein